MWRLEAPRLIGGLVRLTGDLALAEDLAQDALVAALERWPESGVPPNPGAWLMTTARRRFVDRARHDAMRARKHAELLRAMQTPARPAPEVESAFDEDVGDDVLRLMFAACHPAVSREGRVALTLRLLGGLDTPDIARAFLVPVPTVAQRVSRAKRQLRDSDATFEIPRGELRRARVDAVLEVVYLVFNEGYAAARGDDWVRPALCDEAMRLGRVLAAHIPDDAEALGLLALMELTAARTPARTAADGTPILLADQDRARWDRLLLNRGLEVLAVALGLGQPAGPYLLQAAIAATHARAPSADETDWAHIAALCGALYRLNGSPVVALNHAVAVSRADGAAAGLRLLDRLSEDAALARYPYLPAARGDLLEQLDRLDDAASAFESAARLTENTAEQGVLKARAHACRDRS